jgi:hypothetical protein
LDRLIVSDDGKMGHSLVPANVVIDKAILPIAECAEYQVSIDIRVDDAMGPIAAVPCPLPQRLFGERAFL